LELGPAPNHASLHALDAASRDAKRARLDADDQIRDDRFVNAFDAQRILSLDVEHAANMHVGFVTDAQAARRCSLFHTRGNVHCGAANGARGAGAPSKQHAAGVDANADVEAGVALSAADFFAEFAGQCQQCQPASNGALGVVFLGLVGAEHRQYAVAGVLQHLAAECVDDLRTPHERAVYNVVNVFGIQPLAKQG